MNEDYMPQYDTDDEDYERFVQHRMDAEDDAERRKVHSVKDVIALLADEAEKRGADASDDAGIVRQLVTENGLEFNAWFCICCELADRKAQREGFKNQADRAVTVVIQKRKEQES